MIPDRQYYLFIVNLLVILMSYKDSMRRQLSDDQIKVQISMPYELRDQIEDYAKEQGFESIQHFTRIIYKTVLNEQLRFNLLSPSNQIAGTHVTENDIKEYQCNKLAKYLQSLGNEIDDYH